MMAKKKIHKLTLEFENDYSLIGIASHENDYRLSWAINKSLGLDLKKEEDYSLDHPKYRVKIHYSRYIFNDENKFINYILISNKSEKGFLIPEMKNIDYVLRVSGSPDQKELSDLLLKLKKVDIIITAFHINEISDRLGKVFMF